MRWKVESHLPDRSQAQRRYPLRDLRPIPLRRYRFVWWREAGSLIGGLVLVIAAAYLWRFLPW